MGLRRHRQGGGCWRTATAAAVDPHVRPRSIPRRRRGAAATPPRVGLEATARHRQDGRGGARQHGRSAPLAVPQLGFCASSGRAWRLWATRTPRKRPTHWAPSHCLGCSSEPPPKPADFTACDHAGSSTACCRRCCGGARCAAAGLILSASSRTGSSRPRSAAPAARS